MRKGSTIYTETAKLLDDLHFGQNEINDQTGEATALECIEIGSVYFRQLYAHCMIERQ